MVRAISNRGGSLRLLRRVHSTRGSTLRGVLLVLALLGIARGRQARAVDAVQGVDLIDPTAGPQRQFPDPLPTRLLDFASPSRWKSLTFSLTTPRVLQFSR